MKKLLTMLFAFVMFFSLCAAAVTLDTAENATEATGEETAVVSGDTLDIETTHHEYGELIYYNNFELSEYVIGASADQTTSSVYQTDKIVANIKINDAWGSGSTRTFAADPFKTGKVVKVTPKADGTEDYPNSFIAYGNMSGAGTYTFVIDYAADAGITGENFNFEISPRINKNNSRSYYPFSVNDDNRGKWNTAVHQVTFENDTDFLDHFLVQARLNSKAKPYDASKYCFYFDNIRIYYKKPDTSNTGSGVDGAVKTVTFAKELDTALTSVDVGYSEATYVLDGKKCIISAVGYSGIVTISAVFTDGTSETREIKLLGGTKWKPGLNILTGTPDAVTFEDFTYEDLSKLITFSGSEADSFSVNVVDEDSKAVKLSGSEYVGFTVNVTEPIEASRNAYVKMDYKGTFSNAWYYNDSTATAQSFSGSSNSWKFTIFNKSGAINSSLGLNIKKSGDAFYIDNLAVIPRYKVTYVDIDGTTQDTYLGISNTSTWSYDATFTPNASKFASGVTSYKLAEDGKVFSIDTPIALENKDVVIYAAADAETPETVETQEMRFDGEGENVTASIRFKSIVTADQKNKANEFGFIVTRKTFLDKMAELAASDETLETELTFDFKYNGNDLFVSGAAYMKDEDGNVTVEKIVEETDDGDSVFATVLTGIKNDDASQVNETIVVRPYVKYVNGDKEFVFYGESMSNSLVGIAKSVDTSALPADVKANIEAIIALEK